MCEIEVREMLTREPEPSNKFLDLRMIWGLRTDNCTVKHLSSKSLVACFIAMLIETNLGVDIVITN